MVQPKYVPALQDIPLPNADAAAFVCTGHPFQYRVGVRFDAGADGLNTSMKSVWVRFRKYGAPTGNITIGIRKASDGSLVTTIGTWPIEQFGPAATEQSFVVRPRSNTYQMVLNDVVNVEFPSNATDGLGISTSTTQGTPTGYTGR